MTQFLRYGLTFIDYLTTVERERDHDFYKFKIMLD